MPYTIHSIHTIGPLLKTQCMTCYCVTHEATVLSIGSFRVGAERNLIGSGLLYLFTERGIVSWDTYLGDWNSGELITILSLMIRAPFCWEVSNN